MKKKLLILAAVAVSGLAAVVASNNNKVFGVNEAEANVIEVTSGSSWCFCISGGYECVIPGYGWDLVLNGYFKY